jgi:hypothetical protein
MGGAAEYNLTMLDGCLINVREWLKHHTWIQWHIRDEKGHIRLLWEISSQISRNKRALRPKITRSYSRPGSFEDENRWKGYPRNDPHTDTRGTPTYSRYEEVGNPYDRRPISPPPPLPINGQLILEMDHQGGSIGMMKMKRITADQSLQGPTLRGVTPVFVDLGEMPGKPGITEEISLEQNKIVLIPKTTASESSTAGTSMTMSHLIRLRDMRDRPKLLCMSGWTASNISGERHQ